MKQQITLKRLGLLLSVVIPMVFVFGLSLAEPQRTFTQQQKLSPNGGSVYGDQFGWRFAIDGHTALIASPKLDAQKGYAYIFEKQNGSWVQTHQLFDTESDDADTFGLDVALDGNTALISSHPSISTMQQGQEFPLAFFYERENGVWIEKQRVTGSLSTTFYHDFGWEVQLEGDIALISDDNQGSVYYFKRIQGVWVEQQVLTPSDSAVNDLFGKSVALSGDTAVITGWRDYSQTDAYVFKLVNGMWEEQQKLVLQNPPEDNQAGASVALDNGTVLLGVVGDDTDAGAAYIFREENGVWTEKQKLTPSDSSVRDYFGISVALDQGIAVIGSLLKDDNRGAAYLFTETNGIWTQQQKLSASDAKPQDNFGESVALDAAAGTVLVNDRAEAGDRLSNVYVFTDPALAPTETPAPPTVTYTPGGPTLMPEPTATNTPLPDGTVELLVNGGFELNTDGNQSPDGWKLKQENGDKLKCNDGGEPIAYEGLCAFQFKGGDGENSKLQQDVDLTAHLVNTDDTLTLGGRVWTKGDTDSKVTLKVKYASLPTDKIVVDVSPTGNATAKQWTAFSSLQPTLSLTMTDTPSEITLQIKHASPSGKVRYDALSLTQQSNTLIPLELP